MIENFLLILIIMLGVDSIYLKLISNYFNNQIKQIQGSIIKLDIFSAILCYLFLSIGFYHFLVKTKSTNMDAFILGLVIYGVYETTNKAIITNWKWESVILDTIWGGILFSLVKIIYDKINR